MIKCPRCGSTAQVKQESGNTYSCGCGCWFTIIPTKNYNFLFEDEDGEMFFVQCADELKCEPILRENGFDPDKVVLVDVLEDDEAEILGYDTY